jgi:hypothetical protein
MVGFDAVVRVLLGGMQGGGISSSRTRGYTHAWSVVTSTGTTPTVSAPAKNEAAAVESRLTESHTSMICPY